jgi:hypothetical protein
MDVAKTKLIIRHQGTYMPDSKEDYTSNENRSNDSGEDATPECTSVKRSDKVNGDTIHWEAPVTQAREDACAILQACRDEGRNVNRGNSKAGAHAG